MKETFRQLMRLQDLEMETRGLEADVSKAPAEREREERALREAQKEYDEALAEPEKVEAERRHFEREIAGIQDTVKKFEEHLHAVKTNDEYKAKLKEIKTAQDQISSLETEILLNMERADEVKERAEKAKSGLKSLKEHHDRKVAEIDATIAELNRQLEGVNAERKELEQQLPPDLLAMYRKIAKVRRGVALAKAVAGRCTECNVTLRPQLFAEVRSQAAIHTCDSCRRILVYEEESE